MKLTNSILKKIIHFKDDEVFADGGAFIGETISDFIKETGGKYKQIHAFEPDESIYNKAKEYIDSLKGDRISLYKAGLYKETTKLGFQEIEGGASAVISDGNAYSIDVIQIDSLLDDDISFIKMDIEGSEMDALIGSKNTITQKKPKLAIAVYHKPDDLWKIPLYIKNIKPEYEIYLRHYTKYGLETVCYAIARE